jgi:hypothetical protein
LKETSKKIFKEMYIGNRLTHPKFIADSIGKVATAKKPKTRYLVGFDAKDIVFLRKILTDRMFDKSIKNM